LTIISIAGLADLVTVAAFSSVCSCLPQEDLREAFSVLRTHNGIDNQTALRLKKKLAEDFREQLMVGTPTNEDEAGLRRLAAQIRAEKVIVKLFLRHTLHAKLYPKANGASMCFPNSRSTAYPESIQSHPG
jgi:hypothetical protein